MILLSLLIFSFSSFSSTFEFSIAKAKLEHIESNPVIMEKWNRFKEENNNFFYSVNRNLDYWKDIDMLSEKWGYADSGFSLEQSNQRKLNQLKDHFFEYIAQETKRQATRLNTFKIGLKRDYDLDSRNNITDGEAFFEFNGIKTKKIFKRKSLNKPSFFQLKFNSKIFRGLGILSLESKLINIYGLAGINGKVELRARRSFQRLNLSTGLDYFVNDRKFTGYVDKSFGKFLRVRVSADKLLSDEKSLSDRLYSSLSFFKRF